MKQHGSIKIFHLVMIFLALPFISSVIIISRCSAGHPAKPGAAPKPRKYPYPLNELAQEEKDLLASMSPVMEKQAASLSKEKMDHSAHNMKQPDHKMNHSAHKMGIKLLPGQGKEITLTHAKVSRHRLEKWIRTAGALEMESKTIKGFVFGKDSELLKIGQDVRLFTLVRREPPIQGKIVSLIPEAKGTAVAVKPKDLRYGDKDYYIMEIVVNRGRHLAIPNEAILEEGDHRVVYLWQENRYLPRTITTGFQGEIYTIILQGLQPGEEIVTFGSFFIDAQYKLNAAMKTGEKSAHHHHH